MKKKILLSLMILTKGIYFSQIETAYFDKPNLIIGQNSVSNIYIQPDPDVFQNINRSSILAVQFMDEPFWTPEMLAAFEYAKAIVENSITSSVQINIEASWPSVDNYWPSNLSPVLGYGRSTEYNINFNGSGPYYQPQIFYCQPLANKLKGTDTYPNDNDIDVRFNPNKLGEFYFGTDGNCPNNKYDFVTVVIHELLHGLGFASAVVENGQVGSNNFTFKLANYAPTIYDSYIVNSANVRLSSLAESSSAIATFIESNNLYFDGVNANSANGNVNPKIFAPTTFEQGSSIGHLDNSTFGSTPNRLMTSGIGWATAIHNPGNIGVGILNDLGWDAVLYVGIEDRIEIENFQNVLNIGQATSYYMNFIDNEPEGDYLASDYEWKIEVFHNNGSYIVENSTDVQIYFTIEDLPDGFDWLRNPDGTVRGKVTASARDNDGALHTKTEQFNINYKPNKPKVTVTKVQSNGTTPSPLNGKKEKIDPANLCHAVKVSFFAYGATSYKIHYKKFEDVAYTIINVPANQNTYKIDGLQQNKTYEFIVEAINNNGVINSNKHFRGVCGASNPGGPFGPIEHQLIVAPNPVNESVRFISNDNEIRIKNVQIIRIDNPYVLKNQNYSPSQTTAEINIVDLPAGNYGGYILDENDNIYYTQFLKL